MTTVGNQMENDVTDTPKAHLMDRAKYLYAVDYLSNTQYSPLSTDL